MSKKKNLLGLLGIAALTATLADVANAKEKMEKCSIVGADGATMLLLRDCATAAHSCAGAASEPTDWILVPEGTCAKIKGGKVAG